MKDFNDFMNNKLPLRVTEDDIRTIIRNGFFEGPDGVLYFEKDDAIYTKDANGNDIKVTDIRERVSEKREGLIWLKQLYQESDKIKMLIMMFLLLYLSMLYENLYNIISMVEYVAGGLIILGMGIYFWYQTWKDE